MIKPLTTVNAAVNGENIALADGDNAPNLGKIALGSLLKGEDIHASEGEANIIPFHAVDYATVTHSSEEAEDPVDELCTQGGDEPVGPTSPLGYWRFNDEITLEDMTFTGEFGVGSNSSLYTELQVATDSMVFFRGQSRVTAYSGSWNGQQNRVVFIKSVSEESHGPLFEFLKANAEYIPVTVDETTWVFNESPDLSAVSTTNTLVEFGIPITFNGGTASSIRINANYIYFGSARIYDKNASDPWSALPDRTVSFGTSTTGVPFLAYWLTTNATKVE